MVALEKMLEGRGEVAFCTGVVGDDDEEGEEMMGWYVVDLYSHGLSACFCTTPRNMTGVDYGQAFLTHACFLSSASDPPTAAATIASTMNTTSVRPSTNVTSLNPQMLLPLGLAWCPLLPMGKTLLLPEKAAGLFKNL